MFLFNNLYNLFAVVVLTWYKVKTFIQLTGEEIKKRGAGLKKCLTCKLIRREYGQKSY